MEGFNGINFVDEEEEESMAKLKQKKNMLNELLQLQKDVVSKKRKLQAAKLRRDNISGEILFLKQRRRHLLKIQSSNVESERNFSHLEHFVAERKVPNEERSNSSYDEAVETARPAFTSKFNSEHEVGYEELLASRDMLRMERVPKNYLIDDDNRVGKQKLSWHGQVTLKV